MTSKGNHRAEAIVHLFHQQKSGGEVAASPRPQPQAGSVDSWVGQRPGLRMGLFQAMSQQKDMNFQYQIN